MLRIREELLRRCFFNQVSFIEQYAAVADLFGESHLMRHYDHRNVRLGEIYHYIEDFLNHLRIEC